MNTKPFQNKIKDVDWTSPVALYPDDEFPVAKGLNRKDPHKSGLVREPSNPIDVRIFQWELGRVELSSDGEVPSRTFYKPAHGRWVHGCDKDGYNKYWHDPSALDKAYVKYIKDKPKGHKFQVLSLTYLCDRPANGKGGPSAHRYVYLCAEDYTGKIHNLPEVEERFRRVLVPNWVPVEHAKPWLVARHVKDLLHLKDQGIEF